MKFLKSILILVFVFFLSTVCYAEPITTQSGIALDKQWKIEIYQFAKEHFQHSAWGISHYERNYHLSKEIALKEGINIDNDVLFAASFLHDMGVFDPYVVEGADHSKTAVENVEAVLLPTGFPKEKLNQVKTLINYHMFYSETPKEQMAQVFRDADILDFIGSIGVARILSITTRHYMAPDILAALKTIEMFNKDLPSKLSFDSSKKIAIERVKEANFFIETIKKESHSGLIP